MNKEIINNLFEFWAYIGSKTNKLVETKDYKVVSMTNSDWPNRVFSISNKKDILFEIIDLSQQKLLPGIITLTKPNNLENNFQTKLIFGQKNMALNLNKLETNVDINENIHQAKTKKDAIDFANTASDVFGYHVDGEIVFTMSKDPSKVRIFN